MRPRAQRPQAALAVWRAERRPHRLPVPLSEQREWRLSFSVLSLRLLSDAHEALALDSGGGPVLFSLSYTFTSGSTSGTSIESSWHSPTTRLKMPRRDGTELLWRAQPPTADADGSPPSAGVRAASARH